MIPNDAFQKLLYDLFCMWHGVKRHYDPPITDSEEQRNNKVKQMIVKLLTEIDARVARVMGRDESECQQQAFYEEWTMLTWNVLCITSRLQKTMSRDVDARVLFESLNQALVSLVNYSKAHLPALGDLSDPSFSRLSQLMDVTMRTIHKIYSKFPKEEHDRWEVPPFDYFCAQLPEFSENVLTPCLEHFKSFCNANCTRLWRAVREAQCERMRSQRPLNDAPINGLVAFYSSMMYNLAVLAARLQGVRYQMMKHFKVFGDADPVLPLSNAVFSALELLMADCVLATEPSTNAILVTNNLFSMNCGALARGVVFKDFDIQVVSEETAETIQSELRGQKMLQQPASLTAVRSAALLAMKPATGTKRANSSNCDSANNTAHKKSDVNSKESVTIYPVYNAKNRYWLATYPHLLCTTRNKGGRMSNGNSHMDLASSSTSDTSGAGKTVGTRPVFYFHITATLFSPSGEFATAHTLSLPFTIATRRNQVPSKKLNRSKTEFRDCQVQRMTSSYTATMFWLYGLNEQDGLLLQWTDSGIEWTRFKQLYKQYFSKNAEVNRPLTDEDFDLLHHKLQCQDCDSGDPRARANGAQQIVSFRNIMCPHLRYKTQKEGKIEENWFSVWRVMLEVLQIFQDHRNNVRKLWEKGLLYGFIEIPQVTRRLETQQSALIMSLSYITGGTICIALKSDEHSMHTIGPIYLEPLDLKKLQAKCLKNYLRDIGEAENVVYILNASNQLVRIREVLQEMGVEEGIPDDSFTDYDARHISSNVTHSGDIDSMQTIRFTALRIGAVTCRVKPPSTATRETEFDRRISNDVDADRPAFLFSGSDDFVRELIQLCNFYGKSKQELSEIAESLPETSLPRTDPFGRAQTPSYPHYASLSVASSTTSSTSTIPSPNVTPTPYQNGFEDGYRYDF